MVMMRAGMLLSAAFLVLSTGVSAQSLTFTRADVADQVAGQDLWQNNYTFSGALMPFGGLSLIFSHVQYDALDVAGAAPELSASTAQPDPTLGVDGLVTLTSLANQPGSYTTTFTVSYVKRGDLGNHHPYEVFDADFNIIGGGSAVLAVPEPSTSALWLCGVALLGVLRLPARMARR